MAAIYLLPNTLGKDNFDTILPKDVVAIINSLTYFIVENEKPLVHTSSIYCLTRTSAS